MKDGTDSVRDFIKNHLPSVAFGVRLRWKDKASGEHGVKSLLAKAIAKEEGSKQPAQYVAKDDVVETESTLIVGVFEVPKEDNVSYNC